MSNVKHDFAWGDTRGIRQVMVGELKRIGLHATPQDLSQFGYPPHEGDAALISEIRNLIKDLTGLSYDHVLVVGGATHGLNAYIYAAKEAHGGITKLMTRNLYFPFYPQIAKAHDLEHVSTNAEPNVSTKLSSLAIVDSPSNPRGVMSVARAFGGRVVWDAAYHSPTYCGVEKSGSLVCPDAHPAHEAMVGSLNKLTGINGLRVGWLATNSFSLYSKALYYVEATLCGVSGPGQDYATTILERVDMQFFYRQSKRLLDNNREELGRLSYLFGGQPIFQNGMFALFEVDEGIKNLLKKASVSVKSGKEIGDDRDSIRINLANSNEATRAMVDAVVRADKT